MKPIRSLILIAIGMLAFTATASTTAKLEQKQKSFAVTEYTIPTVEKQVVDISQSITLSQTAVAVTVDSMNLKKVKENLAFYTVSKDVGWRSSMASIQNIYKRKMLQKSNQNLCYQAGSSLCRNIC